MSALSILYRASRVLSIASTSAINFSYRTYAQDDTKQEEAGSFGFRAKQEKEEELKAERRIVRASHIFQEVGEHEKNSQTFEKAIGMFLYKNAQRRGHMDFIFAALKQMKEFGVERDLKIYKKLLDLFPKGPMIPSNYLQAEMWHYAKHQDCCIEIMEEMLVNSVYPDRETYDLVINTFGEWTHASKKIKRMMYWMPKFKNANPYKVPIYPSKNPYELAKLAIKMMCRDPANRISIWLTEELEEDVEKSWIVSGQSTKQREHIENFSAGTTLYVDGPFRLWIRNYAVNYFTLTADPDPYKVYTDIIEDKSEPPEEWTQWRKEFEKSKLVRSKRTNVPILEPSLHEQSDGIILSICVTGTSTKDSAAAWISFLQRSNRRLGELAVVFRMKHVAGDLIVKESEDTTQKRLKQENV